MLFDNFEEKRLAIIAQVCINGILMEEYKEYFYELFASKPLIGSYEWSMGDFRDFRLGILSCLLSSTYLRDFYVNKQLDADKFKYLTGNMNVKEACKILPYILNSKDALSFDFNEDKIYGFMSDAVSYSYSEYEDYFLEIDYPYSVVVAELDFVEEALPVVADLSFPAEVPDGSYLSFGQMVLHLLAFLAHLYNYRIALWYLPLAVAD